MELIRTFAQIKDLLVKQKQTMSSLPSLPSHCKAYSSFNPIVQEEQEEDFYNIDLQLFSNDSKAFKLAITHMLREAECADAVGHIYSGTFTSSNSNLLNCKVAKHDKFNNSSHCEGYSNIVTSLAVPKEDAEEYFGIDHSDPQHPVIVHMPKSFNDCDDFAEKSNFSLRLGPAPHEGYLDHSFLVNQEEDE